MPLMRLVHNLRNPCGSLPAPALVEKWCVVSVCMKHQSIDLVPSVAEEASGNP
jgi:hypothetical protein